MLLAPAAAAAELASIDPGHDHVGALVRRSLLLGDLVADLRPAPREQLLQRGLEVHGVLERLRDLGRERLHDSIRRALVAGVQVAGSDHGLEHGGEHPLGFEQGRGALAHRLGRRGTQPLGQRQAHRDGPA